MGVDLNTDRIFLGSLESVEDVDLVLMGDLCMEEVCEFGRANEYYRDMGFRSVVSMDRNGKADVKVDLAKPISKKYHGKFNALLNGSTGEHVENQGVFYNNCDALVKTGGLIMHVGPEEGSFPEHSPYYYNIDFYKNMAAHYNYKIKFARRVPHEQGFVLYYVFIKL